jgi:hypothetical protein
MHTRAGPPPVTVRPSTARCARRARESNQEDAVTNVERDGRESRVAPRWVRKRRRERRRQCERGRAERRRERGRRELGVRRNVRQIFQRRTRRVIAVPPGGAAVQGAVRATLVVAVVLGRHAGLMAMVGAGGAIPMLVGMMCMLLRGAVRCREARRGNARRHTGSEIRNGEQRGNVAGRPGSRAAQTYENAAPAAHRSTRSIRGHSRPTLGPGQDGPLTTARGAAATHCRRPTPTTGSSPGSQ